MVLVEIEEIACKGSKRGNALVGVVIVSAKFASCIDVLDVQAVIRLGKRDHTPDVLGRSITGPDILHSFVIYFLLAVLRMHVAAKVLF